MCKSIKIISAGQEDCKFLSALHKTCFSDGWSEESIKNTLLGQGSKAFLLESEQIPVAFIIYQNIAGEAEIISMGTVKKYQNNGFADEVLKAAISEIRQSGGEKIFLEVAENNAAARKLYEKNGFIESGRRVGYYKADGGRVDAIMMVRNCC